MFLSVKHTTEYFYQSPVSFALQQIRLHPLDSLLQTVHDWSLDIDGGEIETSYRDHHGNHVDLVSALPGAQRLKIIATGQVETNDAAGVLGRVYGRAPLWYFRQTTPLTQAGPQIKALAKAVAKSKDQLSGFHALSAAIIEAVPYEGGQTDSNTNAEDAVKIGKGVCQDHANIFITAAREAGLPARYISGYLLMDDRVDQDASHAWAEVHLDDLGWVGFDVSNRVSPDHRYIRIAIGRDAHDAAPIHGLRGGTGDESLVVSLQVQQ